MSTKFKSISEYLAIDCSPDKDRVRVSICDERTDEVSNGTLEVAFTTLDPTAAYAAGLEMIRVSVSARGLDWRIRAIVWEQSGDDDLTDYTGDYFEDEETGDHVALDPENLPS